MRLLEEAVAAVLELVIDQSGFGSELVRARPAFGVDVQHFVSVGYEPVGDEHSVTLEVDAFGAHVRGW